MLLIAAVVAAAAIAVAVALAREAEDPEQEAWQALPDVPEVVVSSCTGCHGPPDPAELARADWLRSLARMRAIMAERAALELTDDQYLEVWKYFRNRAPDALPMLPPDPADSPVSFASEAVAPPEDTPPLVTAVRTVDLDGDGSIEILVSDVRRNSVSVLSRTGDAWSERVLADVAAPARVEVLDADGDGDLDLAVASLGSLPPTDGLVGSVVLLERGAGGYGQRVLLKDVGRVADVRAGDLDEDGDQDLAVAAFGHVAAGSIGWLEQQAAGDFVYRELEEVAGASHVPVVDIDGDGHLDIVALVSQASERIDAFLGRGDGTFVKRTLYRAPTPLFGSSGIAPADLDGDGDLDLLYSNGDAFDVPAARSTTMLRPYHGVQWLENRGRHGFVRHHLVRFYGAFSPTAADLDGDGDLDIVATSLVSDWADPSRRSLIWLENDGTQQFTAHGIAGVPTHLVTADVADLDGDGRPDIVAGGLHMFGPYDRLGRVTLWANRGPRGR
ncbi:MAG: VCBS repeat-containing protein [Spirochaetaceae bacterium]|nr:VCBS repeat-containing protein [Spirochaetaceae bacterium]